MLDIKKLRDNFEEVKVALKKRGFDIDQEKFQSLDKKRKVLQVDVENLQAEKNKLSSELKNDFLSDVRKRVNEVTKEGYIDPKNNTIDYALLFVPVEGIFQFIVENELQLTNGKIDIYSEAIEKNIIMVQITLRVE